MKLRPLCSAFGAFAQLKSWMTAGATAALLATSASATELVLPSEVAATHWKTGYMQEFADQVAKRSNGEVTVKIFPAGQLYNDQDAMAALGTGAVHMVWPVAVRTETIEPRTGVISLPFALSDKMMTNGCFAKGLTQLMSSYVEPRNLKILGFFRTSDLMFIFREREVDSMEDLKNAKIRVTGGRVFLDTMRSLQTSPVSMAASEMSTALSQGAIDGVFTSPAGWANMIGMTGKYAWYVPGFSLATYAVVVDKGWFDGLPANQQAAIQDSIDDIASRQWVDARAADDKLIQSMVDQGAVFKVADDDELKRWQALANENAKEFSGKYGDVVKQMGELSARCGVGS
ncbi:MAG: TRAP transporter substrate-binding protein DctP [Burkholderiaceae bacterium]|nr:TRAP transporter substrate-binding protein DctP [Burkholderiaceae bacterium]